MSIKPPTKKESLYMSRVAEFGCIACRMLGHEGTPAEIHHVGNGTKSKRSSHYDVIPLCPHHHRQGGYGQAVHAGRKAWESTFGKEQDIADAIRGLVDSLY